MGRRRRRPQIHYSLVNIVTIATIGQQLLNVETTQKPLKSKCPSEDQSTGQFKNSHKNVGFQNSLQKIALNVPTLRCEATTGLCHLHLGTSSIPIRAFFDTGNITTQTTVRN